MSPNTLTSIGDVLAMALPTPAAASDKDLAQYCAKDEGEPMPEPQTNTLQGTDAPQRAARPNVALDAVTQSAVFRDAGERGRYMQDLLTQGVIPKHLDSVAKVENAYKILTQMKLPWEMYLNKTYYVGAQLTVMGEALLSACRATGLLEYLTLEWRNDKNEKMTEDNLVGFQTAACVCKAKRVDEAKEVMFGFTMEEAKAAGLSSRNQNYQKFTKDMLMWRAVGRVLKVLFTEICGGVAIQGVDDLIPMTDEDGKHLKAPDGTAIYRQRQTRASAKLNALLQEKV